MCRLIAIRSRQPAQFVDDLVAGSHSLLCQSRCDLLQRQHADGWGIAAFHGKTIEWARGCDAAFDCRKFKAAAEQVYSANLFAHVRKASKGQPNLANTHPFIWNGWMFMHNGTLTAFDKLQAELLREMPSRYRALVHGQTDSECIFYWLISRLTKAKIVSGQACKSVSRLRHEFAQAILELNDRNQAAKSPKQETAKLNLMLTNERVLVGSRYDNSLWYQTRRNPQSRQIESWLIASEPTTANDWLEIPNKTVFSLDAAWHWNCEAIVSLT